LTVLDVNHHLYNKIDDLFYNYYLDEMTQQCTLQQLELFLPTLTDRTKGLTSSKTTLTVRPHTCHGTVFNNKIGMIADIVAIRKIQDVSIETVVASVHKNYTLTSVDKNIALFEIIYSWLSELQMSKLESGT
jgi:hypothetical protein